MDSDLISSPTRVPDPDFGFAFNDSNFSDRLLRIEIVTSADWAATRKRKRSRSRRDIVKKDTGSKSCVTSAGDEATNSDDCSKVLRFEMLHISSPILAAKSPFFYKLFSNGMMESAQRHVTLRISPSEEAAVVELLNFMYSNTLTVTTAPAILHVFMAADKFDVPSCMRHCSRLLRNLRMTTESALLYLDLPSSVRIADVVQPLTDAAKQFLASRYKDISKYQDTVMNFPLAGIEAILSSDELLVDSEDAVYDFVLKWTRTNYQTQEKRRHILGCLGRYIRFPYMTGTKLRNVLTCNDFDHDFATKNVLDALFFKAEAPYHRQTHATEDSTYTSCCVKERAYKFLPMKVTVFGVRRLQCAVYLDLKREECSHLFPSGWVHSQVFFLGGRGFFLSANCNRDKQSSSHCFGLSLGMQVKNLQVKDSTSFDVDYEFAARSKLTKEYISKYKGNYTFKAGRVSGCRNLFDIPWTSFIGDDGLFVFINGTLHLRAQLTIKRVSRT